LLFATLWNGTANEIYVQSAGIAGWPDDQIRRYLHVAAGPDNQIMGDHLKTPPIPFE